MIGKSTSESISTFISTLPYQITNLLRSNIDRRKLKRERCISVLTQRCTTQCGRLWSLLPYHRQSKRLIQWRSLVLEQYSLRYQIGACIYESFGYTQRRSRHSRTITKLPHNTFKISFIEASFDGRELYCLSKLGS